jgi:phage tail tape-measure protein
LLTLNIRLCLAAGLATFIAVLSGCAGSGRVSLARLASNQDAYVGKEVRTSGRVEEQTNVDGSHYYVLADPAQDLVVLVPARRARPHAGRAVAVRGRFGFNARIGRLIRIATISAAG